MSSMTGADPHQGYLARAPEGAKEKGAYYTPDAVVRSLLSWAVRSADDRLLDPACGDGRFLAGHLRSVGIEQDPSASAVARQRAPGAVIHDGDFFAWAGSTEERFDCAVGNPPFIRFQRFRGEVRKRAIDLCSGLGAEFSALSSSWPLFLVATANLLQGGGRMAFVVPSKIGHAPYSAPLIEYLVAHFERVQILAVRDKLFPELSEDCWILYAEGFGGRTQLIDLTVREHFRHSEMPPRPTLSIPVAEWRQTWNRRLRPYLMSETARRLYIGLATAQGTRRFGDVASVGIGYVSGANDFFHLRPSEAARWQIPASVLQASVRNSRALPSARLDKAVVDKWFRQDDPVLLLRLTKDRILPEGVKRYLSSAAAKQAQEASKCRMRAPWYCVPDVRLPDAFLTCMSGRRVGLVRNDAGCTCTNTLHYVQLRDRSALPALLAFQKSPLFQLSCEIEGHPLGGGMLKLEPREASRILIPRAAALARADADLAAEAVAALQGWRHYAA